MLENKEQIKEVLENDGVIAYVTDTVWGLGCLYMKLREEQVSV